MEKYFLLMLLFAAQCKPLKGKEEYTSFSIQLNKSKYDLFGIPIDSQKSILSPPVGFSSPITFIVDTNFVTFFPVKNNILRFQCKSEYREIYGSFLIIKDITETTYTYTYDMETFLVSTLNVYELICPIRTGEWTYREGNKTSKVEHKTKIKRVKIDDNTYENDRQ
jgi:hypothetical protein